MLLEDLTQFLCGVQSIDVTREEDGEIIEGLVTYDKRPAQRITEGILRASPVDYAKSFDFQWNRFRSTQLASRTGLKLSRDRLVNCTGWILRDLQNSRILELGAGPGRFTE